MDLFNKLYDTVRDAVVDHEIPFAEEIKSASKEILPQVGKLAKVFGLDALICPDSVWFED